MAARTSTPSTPSGPSSPGRAPRRRSAAPAGEAADLSAAPPAAAPPSALLALPALRAPDEVVAASRARRINLDHNNVMDAALGVGRGPSWARLRGLGPALARAREEVREAHRAGATPLVAQLAPGRAEAARALAARWAADFDRVVVFGEAAVVDALLLSCPAVLPAQVRACPGPRLGPLRAALDGAARPLLLLAGQADWVAGQAAQALDGLGLSGPARAAARLTLPADEDGAFSPWSSAALALGALAGQPPEDILAAARELHARGAELAHDLARRLAALSLALAEDNGLVGIDLVSCSAEGQRLGRVCAAGWAAVACKAREGGAVRAPGRDAPRCRALGDEAELQRIHEGPCDQWTLALHEQPAQGAPDAELERVLAAEAAVWLELGRPWAQLRFVEDDPASRLGVALVLLETALTLAVLQRTSPLEMPTADRFRERLSALRAVELTGAAQPQE